jgi:hypothetical protein
MEALWAIGPGDEVITPPNSFVAATAAIRRCSSKGPRFSRCRKMFPTRPHLASFAKLGFAERGTDVDEGTGGEGARVPQFFDRK